MRLRWIFQVLTALALVASISAACSSGSDRTETDSRYERTAAVVSAVRNILDNPDAYGTEEEVVELLATYATPDAVMQDDAFDADMNMRDSWYNTLYQASMDAEIEVLHQWISDDGSQSSGLWVWRGKNFNGHDFELIGVKVDSHNDEGLITHELVLYPYPDDYVRNAALGTGTG
ncbi:MAG: hypothetical protein HKN24_10020 [Acidimicrobiales bacterium]|nr:hypothetical protein [Acidimicrobiales bacterium]